MSYGKYKLTSIHKSGVDPENFQRGWGLRPKIVPFPSKRGGGPEDPKIAQEMAKFCFKLCD